ncbi:CPBP family intramembrane glutamic endopeptidase [Citricoccus nitrophenolicus]|uniref:CPBP family intramembrane glutamic endopeptidase n=1 Tax=Citricoccus nitrophenolicus TaxID=863575 RepID=A0ABV0IHK7_9MICC
MDPTLAPWMAFLLTVLPAVVLVGIVVALLPRQAHGVRIMMLILGFIVARDAMTAQGLWEFGVVGGGADGTVGGTVGGAAGGTAGRGDSGGGGSSSGVPTLWLRFTDDPVALLVLAVASLALVGAILVACRDLRWTVLWTGRRWWTSVLVGLLGGALIVLPFLFLYGTIGQWIPALQSVAPALTVPSVPVDQRGGAVAGGVLVVLAVFALCGNQVEEVLFRGFLQAHLEDQLPGRMGRWRAALLSALTFAAGHLVLAFLLTDLGWPILAFTFLEGLVCAVIALRHGVLGATVAHAGAIFMLASGLL